MKTMGTEFHYFLIYLFYLFYELLHTYYFFKVPISFTIKRLHISLNTTKVFTKINFKNSTKMQVIGKIMSQYCSSSSSSSLISMYILSGVYKSLLVHKWTP